uniref:Uncharacterized protein n=1 Tax=Panagrolaimus sp. ES5 TaxID=591445 RepID=A0AC34FR42_9BILA
MIELIAKNKKGKLQFEGKCKLTIDPFSKLLLVEPQNEEFKMISALFKWKFVADKAVHGDEALMKQRFLPLLFNEIAKKDESNLKEILVNLINKHEGKEKEEFFQLLKKSYIYDLCYPNENIRPRNLRKRKAKDISYVDGSDANNGESDSFADDSIDYSNSSESNGSQGSKMYVSKN